MLSYLHEFHAGNHADILKHFTLVLILESLNKKNKPYTFFDTHSGAGLYNIKDEKALKTQEANNGIIKLLKSYKENNFKNTNFIFDKYINFVSEYLQDDIYPGSPKIEKEFLLKDSLLILSELHNTEINLLKKNISSNHSSSNIQIHHRSGWEMLNALTPPKIKRGAVLIDPSYEELSDYENVINVYKNLSKKWNNGIFILWYPLLSYKIDIIEDMKNKLIQIAKSANQNTEILDAVLCINTKDSHKESNLQESIGSSTPRLYGSGMFIINVPWQIKEQLEQVLPFITSSLQIEQNGSWKVTQY